MDYSRCYKLKFKEEYIPKIESFLNYSPDEDKEIEESYEYFDKAPCGCEVICDGYPGAFAPVGWDCLYRADSDVDPIGKLTKYLYCFVNYGSSFNDSDTICFRTDYTTLVDECFPSIIELKTLEEFFNQIITFGKQIKI